MSINRRLIERSGQYNLTASRIADAHGRCNDIRQVATVMCTSCNTCFHGTTGVKSETASRSVQPLLHS